MGRNSLLGSGGALAEAMRRRYTALGSRRGPPSQNCDAADHTPLGNGNGQPRVAANLNTQGLALLLLEGSVSDPRDEPQ
jgi:hypothetical protein